LEGRGGGLGGAVAAGARDGGGRAVGGRSDMQSGPDLLRLLCPKQTRTGTELRACVNAQSCSVLWPNSHCGEHEHICASAPLRKLSKELFDSLRQRFGWLLLVGDSDMRGLAFSLLQMLAQATQGRAAAIANTMLWLGPRQLAPPPRKPALNTPTPPGPPSPPAYVDEVGSRICHLDWEYDAKGHILSSRVLPCRYKTQNVGNRSRYNPLGYALLGEDFELRRPTGAPDGLRVTFVTITTPRSFVKATTHLQTVVAQHALPQASPDESVRPHRTALLLTTGSWGPYDATAVEVAVAANSLADSLSNLSAHSDRLNHRLNHGHALVSMADPTLLWITTLGQATPGQRGWRNTSFSAQVTDELRGQSTGYGQRPDGHHSSVHNPYSVHNHSSVQRPDGHHSPPSFQVAPEPSVREAAASLLSMKASRWSVLNRTSMISLTANEYGSHGIKLSNSHAPHLVNWIDNQRLLHVLLGEREASECFRPTLPINISKSCTGFLPRETPFIAAWQYFCQVDFE
jgi:hypothetical protein